MQIDNFPGASTYQSPFFVTTKSNTNYYKTPSRTIKSMKTLQTESLRKSRLLSQLRQKENSEVENKQMIEEFVQINREIALLECELKPLRQQCEKLQQQIMSFHSLYYGHDTNEFFKPPDFSSAFIEIQNQRDELSKQLDEVHRYYSKQSIEQIQKEIDLGIHFCELLQESNADLKQQTDDIHEKIEKFRSSHFYQDVQVQRKKIEDLTQEYQDSKHKYQALKAEHFRLTDPILKKEEKDVNQADSVIKLNRKLAAAHRKRLNLSDKYIQLRDNQVKEINLITAALMEDDNSLAYSNFQKGNISTIKTQLFLPQIPLKAASSLKITSSLPHISDIQEGEGNSLLLS